MKHNIKKIEEELNGATTWENILMTRQEVKLPIAREHFSEKGETFSREGGYKRCLEK